MKGEIRLGPVELPTNAGRIPSTLGSPLRAAGRSLANSEKGPLSAVSSLRRQCFYWLNGKMKTLRVQFDIPGALISTLILGFAMAAAVFVAVKVQEAGQ